MCFTDDPLEGYAEETEELEGIVEMLPICSECEKPIEDVYCFVINGEPICEECMEQYKQPTAYLMG